MTTTTNVILSDHRRRYRHNNHSDANGRQMMERQRREGEAEMESSNYYPINTRFPSKNCRLIRESESEFHWHLQAPTEKLKPSLCC